MNRKINKRIGRRSGVLFWGKWVGQVQRSFLGMTYWTDWRTFESRAEAEEWLHKTEYWYR